MKRFSINKPAATLLSLLTLGFFTLLGGCSQNQPPTATVESDPQNTETVSNSESATLKNLQAAYNGESNAHARYLAFSKKAEEEGYLQVATLFQAAADAEAIHAANHAAIIRKMGAKPEATIETPEVKSTLENLEEGISGESYERDTMYPEFIEQARKDGNQDAVVTFTYAVEAETEHAKYYAQAKDNLDDWRENTMTFYVCPECGYTTNDPNFAVCPECGTANNLFLSVS